MIKATGTIGGRRTLILGLEQGNIDRLILDKPIRFDTEGDGYHLTEGVEQIVILWGQDQQEITAKLRLVQQGGFDG